MKFYIYLCLLIGTFSRVSSAASQEAPVTLPTNSYEQPSKETEVCRKILSITIPLAQELLSYSSKARESILGKKILSNSRLSCEGISQKYIIEAGLDLLEHQSSKVGVLLSLKGDDFSSNSVVEGLKLTLNPEAFSKTFVFKPIGTTKEKILESVGELIFVERTGVIIGGTSTFEGETVEKYIRGMMTVFLGLSDFKAPKNAWYFNASPGSDVLVEGMLNRLASLKATKIAVLAPDTATDTLSELAEKSPKNGIQVVRQATYTPKSFDSLETAIKQLLKLNPEGREEEFKELVKVKTAEAESNGQTFKVENVRLPPIQDFDYLVLPDDFKMIRHITKMLKFHGVSKIKLVGNHLWRSETLIVPWDNLLKESFFVDFIGSYLELPFKIDPPPENPLFLIGTQASQIDFKMLGYRAGGIALSVLKFADNRHRTWSKTLLEVPINQLGFGNTIAFNAKRKATWPIRYFVPTAKGVVLLPLSGIQNKISKNTPP